MIFLGTWRERVYLTKRHKGAFCFDFIGIFGTMSPMENHSKKNKILMVAHGLDGFKDPCRKALVKLGYSLDQFDYRTGLYFSNKIVRKIYRTIPGMKWVLKKNISRKFLKKVRESKPDYIFALKAELVLPEAIKEARKMGAITINWYPEYVWHWEINTKLAPAYDFFFSPDNYVLNKLKKELGLSNCYYLPFAADIDENHSNPFENRSDIYDISMIASYSSKNYASRAHYLDSIKDLGLNIFGPRTWLESPLKNCYRGKVGGEEVFDVYRKTKIVPNIHYGNDPAEAINLRPFEAMGSGALLVSDDIRADMFRLFKDGEEFVSFHGGDSKKLRELCKYYLDNPEERIKIAKQAHQSILNKHTYTIRMKQMMKVVGDNYNISFY
jgi:spore maturation protein CgeB